MSGGVALRKGDELLGFADYVYVPFFIDDWEGTACYLGNICVHPTVQGLDGLNFVRVSKDRAPTPIHYASQLNQRLAGIWGRMRAQPGVGSEITYERTLSVLGRATRRLMRTQGGGISRIHRGIRLLKGLSRSRPSNEHNYSVVQPGAVDDEWLNEVWEATRTDAEMGIIRTASYLRWRYQHHPRSNSFHWILVNYEAGTPSTSALVILDLDLNGAIARISEIIGPVGSRSHIIPTVIEAALYLGANALQTKAASRHWSTQWSNHGFQATRRPYSSWMYFDRRNGSENAERMPWFTYGDFKPM